MDIGGLEACVFHLNFGRPRRGSVPLACYTCGYLGERRCDRIVDHSVLIHGEPKRCDRWICIHCTTEPAPGKDLCPECALLYRAWLAARTNTTDGDG